MISSVDTNILLDVFLPDKGFAQASANLLKLAYDEGGLIISHIVYAELVPQFKDRRKLDAALSMLSVSQSPIDADIAFLAGERWAHYRRSGGKRKRIITDFLIAAHAELRSERFLTRDRGFYDSYFPELRILAP
ncbi:MAG TPA: PIN domain-containing protein [Desulfobacterales bacterium]|nr:PIN domain-containing protein [Desulfobacterales bacterium]